MQSCGLCVLENSERIFRWRRRYGLQFVAIVFRNARFFERGSTFNRMQYLHCSTFDIILQWLRSTIYRTGLVADLEAVAAEVVPAVDTGQVAVAVSKVAAVVAVAVSADMMKPLAA